MENSFLAIPADAKKYIKLLNPGSRANLPRKGKDLLIVPPGKAYHKITAQDNGLFLITLNCGV